MGDQTLPEETADPVEVDADPVDNDPEVGTLTPMRAVRKVAIGVIGGTVTAAGIALMPLPGPGTPIVLAGLAILATEFEVARRALDAGKRKAKELLERRK